MLKKKKKKKYIRGGEKASTIDVDTEGCRSLELPLEALYCDVGQRCSNLLKHAQTHGNTVYETKIEPKM